MTVVASLTLLPALLGFAGERIEVTRWRGADRHRLPRPRPGRLPASRSRRWPASASSLAVVVLLAGFVRAAAQAARWPAGRRSRSADLRLPVEPARSSTTRGRPPSAAPSCSSCWPCPVLGLRLGFSDESNFAEDTTTRQAYDLLVDGFGPGFNGPFFLAARGRRPGRPGRCSTAITAAVAADPGVAFVVAGSDARNGRTPSPPPPTSGRSRPTTSPAGRGHHRARAPPPRRGARRRRGGARQRDRGHRPGAGHRRLLRPPQPAGCPTSSWPCWSCRSCC